MSDKRGLDDLSVEELERLLYLRKRAERRKRLRRLKAEGRVVDVDGLPPPDEWLSEFVSEEYDRGEDVDSDALETAFGLDEWEAGAGHEPRIKWRWVANKMLLLVEIAVVDRLGHALALTVWGTTRELNREIALKSRRRRVRAWHCPPQRRRPSLASSSCLVGTSRLWKAGLPSPENLATSPIICCRS